MNRVLLPFQGWRLHFFRGAVVAMLIVLVLRTWQLQFIQGASFRADADENRFQTLPLAAPRGKIYDRNGQPLALNDAAFLVTVTPALLPDDLDEVLQIYNRLSALVDVPATRAIADASGRVDEISIDEKVREGEGIAPFRAVVIASDVDENVAREILESRQSLPGVAVEVRSVRRYPSGEKTSQIIGYLGPISEEQALELIELGYDPAYDRVGYAGIEAYFETELKGINGSETTEIDVAGQPLRLVDRTAPQPGVSIQLTIDLELQEAAQRFLVEGINQLNARERRLVSQSGVVIAMNPKTGEILAMVSWPTYDNSRFARSIDAEYYFDLAENPLTPLVNHAIGSLYPPGSVWKMLTSVAVQEEDVIDPATPLFDGGSLVLPNAYAPNDIARGQTFVCWLDQGHGTQNLIDAIANSCDVYFYQVGGGNPAVSEATLKRDGLGVDNLYRWATTFGIGSDLGVEIFGETAGRMPDRDWKRRVYGESWSTGDTYNAAFGQGYVTLTPLQQLAIISAIINDGVFMQPTLLKNFQDASGNILQEFPPQVMRTIVPPADGSPMILNIREDMLVQGANSLSCRCESDSPYYAPERCNPDTYTGQFDSDPAAEVESFIQYRVHVPYQYRWNAGLCDPLAIQDWQGYTPPIASIESFRIAQQGMLEVVTRGTSSAAANPAAPPLGYVTEGGKTGTAEYCDDIARPQGLCIPGRWPSHAWYVGYAPADDPEIAVVAFIYNGGEGSQNAMPIVRRVLDYYFRRPAPEPETETTTTVEPTDETDATATPESAAPTETPAVQ
ncbi:MAG: penicillin-binding protein 2 [Chloroflexi bacterium]|nr:penicillin-binding protein 2 [Chloroflexota bacterium]NOG61934.1 penicillin-binding protein 2 [Chloroflexota bacterium]